MELLLFLGFFAWNEADFFKTKVKHEANGYTYWERLEPCRAPSEDQNVKSLVMTTPTGKKLVCFKQTQRPE